MADQQRTPSSVDAVADSYVDTLARLDPLFATEAGIPGHDHELPDLSPAGHEAYAAAAREVLRALDDAEARAGDDLDATDRVTLAAMRERVGLDVESFDAGDHLSDVNNIASPAQGLRDVIDLMPTATVADWENVAARLTALPAALDGYVETLREGVARGQVAARRQVVEVARQARELAHADESFFTSLVRGPEVDAVLDGSSACSLVRRDLEHGASDARAAYGRLAAFLTDELAAHAPERDAVGRERYARASRQFLGATIDLDEAYAWGLDNLARVVAEQEATARRIAGPGATVEDAVAALDADPARVLDGTDALRAWMQETSDGAIAALDGRHFDIPGPLRTLECRIAPTQSGGIYYTGPSDDMSRPGRMWWSVPPGVTQFSTWREKTTVFHEGVPGHHLQVGQAVFNRAALNRWRRLACWVSGHGEGWALYAERLMADLGFLEDDGDRFGMLDSQRLRAARVVFDLGVHLELPAPEEWGGGTWDADKAWAFLRANVNMDEGFQRFEWMRYLGWPGQAPSYALGQRLWEEARDSSLAADGAAGREPDLRGFHARALALGSVGLDVLRDALSS
ncbi:DUF885 domain-containing protein [Luteimicrobium subarcticum]|uniref:Uncharacterized protein (DUF885 family) n=1 Tax=Luteimicrobium subarcticum TaxID=620910 RepID=A0A2M8WUD9_9MICO|nr:DUF885 domain-containing protein [Luteimicrobium subarcticum]PJI94567.1 uncharacterized protein (DUF885 family) [Luteimicrobium subarcticum]